MTFQAYIDSLGENGLAEFSKRCKQVGYRNLYNYYTHGTRPRADMAHHIIKASGGLVTLAELGQVEEAG